MAGIIQLEGTAQTFGYNGLIAFGTAVTDYDTATADTILQTMVGVGQVPDGTTEWTGEATSMENWVDEAGNVLDVTVTQGTHGFSFEVASISKKQLERWLEASSIDVTWTESGTIGDTTKVVGVADFPIQTLPGLIISQDLTQAFFYPKMQVVGGITYADKKFRLSVAATALTINTASLKTFMKLDGKINME